MNILTDGISALFENYLSFTALLIAAILFVEIVTIKKEGYYDIKRHDEIAKNHVLNRKYGFSEIRKGDLDVHKVNITFFYTHIIFIIIVAIVCLVSKNVVAGFIVYTVLFLIGDPLLNTWIGKNKEKYIRSHKRRYRQADKKKNEVEETNS